MDQSKTLRLDGAAWDLLEGVSTTGPSDELARVHSEHRGAPVRATLVPVNREHGVRTELSLIERQAVLVTRRLARTEGSTKVEPGAQVTFATIEGLWPVLAQTMPEVSQLRAPSSAVGGRPDQALDLSQREAIALVRSEDFALRVDVEAWTGAAVPAVRWVRQWSVIDERLIDVRSHSDGTFKLIERPAGSVAAELRWALVAAIETVSGYDTGAMV